VDSVSAALLVGPPGQVDAGEMEKIERAIRDRRGAIGGCDLALGLQLRAILQRAE